MSPSASSKTISGDFSTNLVSHWALGEASGTRADSTANNNDLTDENTVLSAAGKQGDAADFEQANSERLSIADGSFTGWPTGSQTYSFWVKPESLPSSSGLSFILSKNGATAGTWIGIDNLGKITFSGTDGTANAVTSATALSTGTWYHIACVFTASTRQEIFINGSSDVVDTTSIPSAFNKTTQTMYLGIQSNVTGDATYHFDGLIDEMSMWSAALTSGNITDIYNSGNGIPYA